MELRDLTYYANDTDIELALVNLDWYKAFDLVSMEFTLKALHKLGFGDRFIHWISILYNNIESSVLINNILGDFFPISRSVRQGCPLSMGLFMIYQEAFYRAIIKSRVIRPLRMPNADKKQETETETDFIFILKILHILINKVNLVYNIQFRRCTRKGYPI